MGEDRQAEVSSPAPTVGQASDAASGDGSRSGLPFKRDMKAELAAWRQAKQDQLNNSTNGMKQQKGGTPAVRAATCLGTPSRRLEHGTIDSGVIDTKHVSGYAGQEPDAQPSQHCASPYRPLVAEHSQNTDPSRPVLNSMDHVADCLQDFESQRSCPPPANSPDSSSHALTAARQAVASLAEEELASFPCLVLAAALSEITGETVEVPGMPESATNSLQQPPASPVSSLSLEGSPR